MRGQKIFYSEEELLFIKTHCTLPRTALHIRFCEQFERSDVSKDNIKHLCQRKDWKTGRSGCYAKGSVPANKGTKGLGNPKSLETCFKKGNKPHNYKPVGSKKHDTKDKYEWTKIADPNIWKQSHYLLFEKHHKRNVKPDYILAFKDGDKTNIVIDNIEEITRSELVRLNKMHYKKSPSELKPTIKLMAQLHARAGELSNG